MDYISCSTGFFWPSVSHVDHVVYVMQLMQASPMDKVDVDDDDVAFRSGFVIGRRQDLLEIGG